MVFFRRPLLAVLLAMLVPGSMPPAWTSPAWGQEGNEAPAPETVAPRQALEAVEESLSRAADQRDRLAEEVRKLAADGAALNRRLIMTAQSVKEKEAELTRLERDLAVMDEQEARLRGSLSERRGTLIELLAAVQRLGRNPPPALLIHPEDALASIRSAAVLGRLLPEMRARAEAVIADLTALAELKTRTLGARDAIARENDTLVARQQELALLVDAKRAAVASEMASLREVERRSAALAREAEDLRGLLESAEVRIVAFRRHLAERAIEEARRAEDFEPVAPESTDSYFASLEAQAAAEPGQEFAARSDPDRIRPAISFSRAQGLLPLPAAGVELARFGEEDGLGGRTEGLSIATRRGAQVTAPSDAWVVYAGPFRRYGELLILDAGEGYHVILAGMERITVALGQFVLAGEPVGTMGGAPSLVTAAAMVPAEQQPVLYVEFRKDGRAIDPDPWWTTGDKVGG